MVSAGAAGNTIKSAPGTGTVTSAVTATVKPTSGAKVSSGAASAATKQTGTGALAAAIGVANNIKKKYNIKGYSKGGLITKDDRNPLNEVAEAVGEDTMIAVKEGEYVLNTEQVKKWGYKLTPEQIQSFRELDSTWKHAQMTNDIETIWNLTGLQSSREMPEHTRNNKPNISMHYDSLITVNGDVNDTNHFLKQIQGVSQKVVNNTLKKIDRDFKYHGY